VPANRVSEELRGKVIELAQGPLAGFNPVHMSEALAETEDPIDLSARTVRRILAGAGLRPPRTRRRRRHHERRERMAQSGMLLQTDGSTDDWLEDRGPRLTLVGGIDDATSAVTGATFRAAEDAAGYFLMLTETVRTYGVPVALYTDRAGIFIRETNRPPTLAEQLTGRRSLTQVGRALQEAGIGWIGASSPQAKGRIERLWGTLQDRLRSELRRAGVDSVQGANELLAWYLPRHNKRFGVPASIETPAWRPWDSEVPPEAVFCFHYRRRIESDATVSWPGGALALPARADGEPGVVAKFSWRSVSMARSGLAPAASTTNSNQLRRTRPFSEPAMSKSPSWSSHGPSRRENRAPRPSLRHTPPGDQPQTIHGGAILLSDHGHGDKVAVPLAAKVAVRRHARMDEFGALEGAQSGPKPVSGAVPVPRPYPHVRLCLSAT
jgi:hypothetical protein